MARPVDRRSALLGLGITLVQTGVARAAETPGAPAGTAAAAVALRAAPRREKLAPVAAEPADLWCFDEGPGGALLRARFGEEVRVELSNDTPKPLSLHWQGVRGPAASDGVGGVSGPPVAPGASGTVRFTPPDAGTFLIRPMNPGSAGEASGRGLAGVLVVAEREPPVVDADIVVLVRDWLVEPSGALSPFGRAEEAGGAGRLGNLMTCGGEPAPRRVRMPAGSRVRLRLVNGCNARIMRIRFDGLKAYVAAVDGQPTDTFEPLRSTLPFAPGSRYDVFVDLPADGSPPAAVVALVGPGVPLVVLEPTGGAVPVGARPAAALPPNRLLPPEIKLQNAVRATIAIEGGHVPVQAPLVGGPARIWRLNGTPGAADAAPLFSARRGQPVVLALANRTGFVQPMHLHGHVFRLLHAADDGWEPYWLDTLQVPEGKTVHIAFLADNPGRWALTSSVLERFDTGLWGTFEVT